MFRIVQECITNVLRHSQSATAEIRIRHDDTSVSLEVQDHGRGITDQRLAATNEDGSGVGIRGMRNRVRQLNGQMKVESGELGTVISIGCRSPSTFPSAASLGQRMYYPRPFLLMRGCRRRNANSHCG
jgi:signal transduction histidine kinase